MNLFQVRKGQFVYFNNELCRVYSVKPFLKKSVHLVRLRDLEQRLTVAKNIDLYKPQHLDSFLYNRKRFTLHYDKKAKVGDYIMVVNPRPDSIDDYDLHAIEKVHAVEEAGVVSDRHNGIRHDEYWLLLPGRSQDAKIIDLKDAESVIDVDRFDEEIKKTFSLSADNAPVIGDVYKKVNENLEAMVIAIQGENAVLGGNVKVPKQELIDHNKWLFLYNSFD